MNSKSGQAARTEIAEQHDAVAIRIYGARAHNLKDIDLEIPRNQLVVITGPSGSGKSSLARDTLCAESQRQYVESLSIYARQFFSQMERPDVDLVEGLQPTISIDQGTSLRNPRSTVATLTETYDYLRLLMARLGQAFCHQCGNAIAQQTPKQILDSIARLPEGTKAMILAPLVRGRKGKHQEIFEQIRKLGFVRARVDGEVIDVEQVPELSVRKNHDIEAIVDRIVIRPGLSKRTAESIHTAIEYGKGTVILCYLGSDEPAQDREAAKKSKQKNSKRNDGSGDGPFWRDLIFSTRYACPRCEISYDELEPRTFSFNSPYGACPECDGLGVCYEFDPEIVIPDDQLSLARGAVLPWKGFSKKKLNDQQDALAPFLKQKKWAWDSPIAKMSAATRRVFLRGNDQFIGLLNLLEQELATTSSSRRQELLESFRGEVTCSACQGSRLCDAARGVQLAGRAIQEITACSVTEAIQFMSQLKFEPVEQPVAEPIMREILRRLQFLEQVGLDYLTLDRSTDTLSGGELQRVRLATGIGSGLIGICYVLDEPSIGLHSRDNQRLIDALRNLQQQGNTVLVVEHDEAMMRASDHLIDLGPTGGQRGGHVVASGNPDTICRNANSITGKYLSGKACIPPPKTRRVPRKGHWLELIGATANNLQHIDVRFPLETFICITGVSGSGKSSLIHETLARAAIRKLGGVAPKPAHHRGLRGLEKIEKLILVDQRPLGRSPRSNPATFTGIFDNIRKIFAATKEARARGFNASRFSFNNKGGRCEACQGHGERKINMNFLPDMRVPCSECRGKRFNRQTLEVRYRDLSIADVLDLQISEGKDFFKNLSSIHRILDCLDQVGLGYLTLGQPSSTLSGGEAQRVKLATELGKNRSGRSFYILDEPTTGLHFEDLRRLLCVFQQLVDQENTVLVIEHHLNVIQAADWVIDLGPEGGHNGGRVVASGTPETVARTPGSVTGAFLEPMLRCTAR